MKTRYIVLLGLIGLASLLTSAYYMHKLIEQDIYTNLKLR